MTKQIPLLWTGALNDTSGYASASRNYILSLLDSQKVDLALRATSFEQEKTTHGIFHERTNSLIGKKNNHKIQIIHLTPENYPLFKDPNIYNIAYSVWETDKLPNQWVDLFNSMDEVWVPSDWNVSVFKNSGVTKPVICIPHVIPAANTNKVKSINIADSDTFCFYSIFQWIERKNPACLLKAFFTEFKPEEKVALALKTYRLNTSPAEQELIKKDILTIKDRLRLPSYPSIYFFGNLLPQEYVNGLHSRGDCFVLPHRGEGFGIPIAEAMSFGKPVISTNFSGNLQFMNEQNSYLINYDLCPVYGMLFPNYHGLMNWAEPSINHLKKTMRYVFEHRDEIKKIGLKGQQTIEQNFNSEVIGRLMINRLEQIISNIG